MWIFDDQYIPAFILEIASDFVTEVRGGFPVANYPGGPLYPDSSVVGGYKQLNVTSFESLKGRPERAVQEP
jgi:hypothetical protein